MNVYAFHRENGWYPIEETSDDRITEHVARNPGTLRVVNQTTGKVVFDAEVTPARKEQVRVIAEEVKQELAATQISPSEG